MENDEILSLLKKIEKVGKKQYTDPNGEYLGSFRCALKNAGYEINIDPGSLRNKDILFKYIITYSFERQGFNATTECKVKCEWCKKDEKNKLNLYAVKVLEALRGEIEDQLKSDSSLGIEDIAKKWKEKFDLLSKKEKENSNIPERVKKEYFKTLVEFYKNGCVEELISYVKKGELKNAYNILRKIHGIGDKIARCIVRDSVQFLREGVISDIKEEEKEYLLPIDIWVRRITFAIPWIRENFISNLTRKMIDFVDSIIVKKEDEQINKLLREAILGCCKEYKINPIYFESGCYYIGAKHMKIGINKNTQNRSIAKMILKELKNILQNFETNY